MSSRKIGVVLLVGVLGCGGKVTFQAGEPEGEGGDDTSAECVAGSCGELCNKCEGNHCFSGTCDDEGFCVEDDEDVLCLE